MFTVISSVLLHFHSRLCSYVLWCFCIFLSDASEVNDGQKRRRLEASGQENRSPKPSSSGRIAELETKPDTPMVPSVRSRVQELTQRRGGNPTLEVFHQHLPKKTNSTKTWTLNGCWIKLYLFGSEKLVIECICVRIQTHENITVNAGRIFGTTENSGTSWQPRSTFKLDYLHARWGLLPRCWAICVELLWLWCWINTSVCVCCFRSSTSGPAVPVWSRGSQPIRQHPGKGF